MNRTNENKKSKPTSGGFLKIMRSPESQELLRDPLAFGLLTVIAFRARWRSAFSADGLQVGAARIGDWENCGMTRREYRTRVDRLVKWGLIEVRPTRKGTVARLTSTAIFDINLPPNECLTSDAKAKKRPTERPSPLPVKNQTERPTARQPNGRQTAIRRPVTKKGRREQRNAVVRAHARNGAPLTGDLAEIAASSNSDVEFVERLQPHFPSNNPRREYNRYLDYCQKKNLTATREGFLNTWMARARPELKPLPRPARKEPPPAEPDISEQEAAARLAKFKADNQATLRPAIRSGEITVTENGAATSTGGATT